MVPGVRGRTKGEAKIEIANSNNCNKIKNKRWGRGGGGGGSDFRKKFESKSHMHQKITICTTKWNVLFFLSPVKNAGKTSWKKECSSSLGGIANLHSWGPRTPRATP